MPAAALAVAPTSSWPSPPMLYFPAASGIVKASAQQHERHPLVHRLDQAEARLERRREDRAVGVDGVVAERGDDDAGHDEGEQDGDDVRHHGPGPRSEAAAAAAAASAWGGVSTGGAGGGGHADLLQAGHQVADLVLVVLAAPAARRRCDPSRATTTRSHRAITSSRSSETRRTAAAVLRWPRGCGRRRTASTRMSRPRVGLCRMRKPGSCDEGPGQDDPLDVAARELPGRRGWPSGALIENVADRGVGVGPGPAPVDERPVRYADRAARRGRGSRRCSRRAGCRRGGGPRARRPRRRRARPRSARRRGHGRRAPSSRRRPVARPRAPRRARPGRCRPRRRCRRSRRPGPTGLTVGGHHPVVVVRDEAVDDHARGRGVGTGDAGRRPVRRT